MFYICHIANFYMCDDMSKRIRLGRKEKELLDFLKNYPDGIWRDELIKHFVHTDVYYDFFMERLWNLEKKGLIEIKKVTNPETGRKRLRVYLKQ